MPKAHRADVVENYHGTLVADPYRWMEDPHSPDTKAWVEGQNKTTRAFIDGFSGREDIKHRLTELWDYPKYFVPRKTGTRYFFQKNDGLQNQAVLYMQESLDSEPALVLDPNKLSNDGTVALTDFFVAEDAHTIAYSVAENGSDWQQIRIRDINSGLDHHDVIRWCKFTNVAWAPDSKGFFYTRFPEPGTVPPEEQSYNSKVYYHRLGTDQVEDKLIYERPDFKQLGFHARITEDEKYLILSVWHGTDPQNRVYYRELASDGPFIRLLDDADASYDFVGNIGERFYFHSDYQAPKGRVVSIDVSKPERANWEAVVPEQQDVLASISAI
ncbi:MAG: S9 family peptidase, partial [Bacillota bacterium]|nr:S9 family peptidase [Bacillota bacterium]